MSEDILLKFHNRRERDILFSPRSGEEMKEACGRVTPIYLYSDLCRMVKNNSPAQLLARMFKRALNNVILLQDPSNLRSGHWFSVTQNPRKKEIYFFSTYGGKPDVEKVSWVDEDDLRESGQFMNLFNDGLHDAQKHGWKIYYNDFPYQKPDDKTAVCGIYTAAFIRSGCNPDEFEEKTKQLMKEGINPAIYYYDKYFI